MFATMSVAALLVVVYCVLIARHLAVVRAEHRDRTRPLDVETAAARALLDGTMTRAAYRATMESVARQAGHLLRATD
ncbi:hypothetical protein AB0K00_16770 [Dactylosporangium sp. NPDC049525]|uniref:hypothetical protein n=1 Tax=Dactylosporangium sp. NPDC049525 TaxID=3154730 RepID=UPI00341FB21C